VALCRDLGVPMIYEAASGAEALALLGMLVLPPELLMLDLEMPGMDGVELIQQLRQRDIIIPMILASGREPGLIQSVETMARNLGMPVLAALRKPLTRAAVQARLTQSIPARGLPEPARPAPAPAIVAAELAAALVDGRIDVHYQPKVDMRTGIVRGVEALARWRDLDGEFVRPDLFIALAEREGMIHDLTRIVMAKSLAQVAQWNARGLKLSMAINLSPRLLDRPALVQEALGLVERHEVHARQVVFEITESSVVDGAALGVLARLRLKGFGLSIDDYGTGFSSMRQLARIPFTELKIDRSFVHGAHQRHNVRVILESALDMARRLGLVTVAEGVETLEDWRLLQEFGCDQGQGYLIARPMPASEIAPWLKQHKGQLRALRSRPAGPARL
jgi:EAL domain-containing protein (putative c-di-GMP-specific phosphodiesterase class I)/CheY-like chemotaxis protein